MTDITLPLILTLKLDSQSFEFFDHLRQQFFPKERNFLPAHITLFHALPGDQKSGIQEKLHQICSEVTVLSLKFSRLRFLGRGVAVEIDSPALIQLHQQFSNEWQGCLTRQDQQRYQPHITLQNKVTSAEARQLYDQLSRQWHIREGCGEGLLLWYYRGGPWELVEEFSFKNLIS